MRLECLRERWEVIEGTLNKFSEGGKHIKAMYVKLQSCRTENESSWGGQWDLGLREGPRSVGPYTSIAW